MSEKIKQYPNGQKKKEVQDIVKNGHNFKLITSYDEIGNVVSLMEKPNIHKIGSSLTVSGAHVLANSEQNHCDFFQGGSLVYKEYPTIRGSTNYGYTISGARIITEDGN